MYGRYGTDTLNKTLFITYAVLVVVFMVVSLFVNILWLNLVHLTLSIIIVYVMIFRTFSRNIQKRRRENEKFCGFFKLRRNKFRDRKTHIYKKCPHCKAVLRLPKAKGKHSVICPRCKNRFSVGR